MEEVPSVKGYISVKGESLITDPLPNHKYSKLLKEANKGTVNDIEVKIPKKLGAEHPFDFYKIEKYSNKVGLLSAAVNKITDSIMGDFTITSDNENVDELLKTFIEESDMTSVLRPWIKEAVLKGNGFMELTSLNENKLRVLNANRMYVKRDKKGNVKSYNQYNGDDKRIRITEDNIIPFAVNEIAHLTLNANPDDAYGQGLAYANLKTIDNYASSEIDSHKLITRKAGAPIHVKVGQPGEIADEDAIDSIKTSLQFINTRTEWVTDANVDISVIDFNNLGKSLTEMSDHDVEQFAIGMQIPLVLMGKGNIPEGLAKVQLEAYQRMIGSLRIVIEDVIETKILIPYLQTQGIVDSVDFVWSMPGEDEKNQRLTTIQTAMASFNVSPELHAALEKEYAEVLGLNDVADLLPTPEEAREQADEEKAKQEELQKAQAVATDKTGDKKPINKKRDKEEKKPQPRVPGTQRQSIDPKDMVHELMKDEPDNSMFEIPLTEEQILNMTLEEYVNITEIPGFNYADFLVKILQTLKVDKFSTLAALNEQDLIEGLLPEMDVEKLRVVLKDGFRKNQSIRDIEKEINQNISLNDRRKLVDGELKTTALASARPNMIARTETVRLANEGLIKLYDENDIKKYRFLSALDERTCSICSSLDGKIFKLNEASPGNNMAPLHVNCRCTSIAVI